MRRNLYVLLIILAFLVIIALVMERPFGKGEKKKEPPQVRLAWGTAGELAADYISDELQRLRLYKQWARISDLSELREWEDELKDRFGPLPAAARELGAEAELRLLASRRGITAIELWEGKYVLRRGRRALGFIPVWRGEGSPVPRLIKLLKGGDEADKLRSSPDSVQKKERSS